MPSSSGVFDAIETLKRLQQQQVFVDKLPCTDSSAGYHGGTKTTEK